MQQRDGQGDGRNRTSIRMEDEGCVWPLGAHSINDSLRVWEAELCKLRGGQQAGPGIKQLHHLPQYSNLVSVQEIWVFEGD